LTIRPVRQIDESDEFCEDFLDDVRVPDVQRIGELNEGWALTRTLLAFERTAVGRLNSGIVPRGPGAMAPARVALAQRAGRLDDPVVRQKLALAHTMDFVDQSLASRIEQLGRLGRLNPGVAAYGKLFRGIYTPIRARLALEIGGVA